MKRKKKQIGVFILVMTALFFALPMRAQVTIGSQQTPDANALLDFRQGTGSASTSAKGLLLPRMALRSTTDANPLNAHVKGMFVYNTATASSGATAVSPGIYYNDGTQWVAAAGGQSSTPATTGNFNYVDATSSYPMTADDGFVRAVYPTETSPTITITFPANVSPGRIVYIANMSGYANMYVMVSPGTKDSQIPGVPTGMIGTYVYLGTQGWYLVAMFSLSGLGNV